MNTFLKWFIGLWVTVAIGINVVAIVGMFMHDGFWGGLGRVQHTYSPFNIFNWIMEVVLLSPALAAAWWLERRKQRAQHR